LAVLIEQIKANLKEWKIEQGYMSVNQAVSRLPFGTFAIDISQIEEVTEQNYENDWGQRNSMIMTYGMAGLLICVGGGIAVYIISMATKGGI
jgi:predicted AlkP superfamily phosphohydrolase/phosphomutase